MIDLDQVFIRNPDWRDRFVEKVSVGAAKDCWEWRASTNSAGYGHFWINGSMELAHRVAFFLAGGNLDDHEHTHHQCGNPLCVNPAHLEGKSRGGHAREHRSDMSAVDEQLTEQIVELREEGLSTYEIGDKVGLGAEVVGEVLAGKGFDLPGGGDRALTPQTRREIARRYKNEDVTQKELADQYGVSQRTISRIIRRQGV